MSSSDEEGQAPRAAINAKRVTDRTVSELIGLVRGVLADGEVNQAEAEFLEHWMRVNADYIDHWQCAPLYARLQEMLEDGKLDHDEERELLDTLSAMANPATREDGKFAPNESLCDAVDPNGLELVDARVCFTGKFVTDSRKKIEARCSELTMRVVSSVSQRLDYLVIGSCGSRDWLLSTHGTKIRDAQQLKAGGGNVVVVPERIFMAALEQLELRIAAL